MFFSVSIKITKFFPLFVDVVNYIYTFFSFLLKYSFPGGIVVKNSPANAGDTGNVGLISGSGRSPGVGNGNPLHLLAWKISWTEEPDELQSLGSQRVGYGCVHKHTHN